MKTQKPGGEDTEVSGRNLVVELLCSSKLYIKVWSSNTCENLYPSFYQMVTNPALVFILPTQLFAPSIIASSISATFSISIPCLWNLLFAPNSLRNKLDEFTHFPWKYEFFVFVDKIYNSNVKTFDNILSWHLRSFSKSRKIYPSIRFA